MLHPLKFSTLAFLAVAVGLAAPSVAFSQDSPRALHLTAVVTNRNVVISWPVLPGRWALLEQEPAFNADWKPVPADKYRTNELTVSVSISLPSKPALFQLRRTFGMHPPTLPNLPPVPPPPTNRPAMPRPQIHP